jgi:hypothetical protein
MKRQDYIFHYHNDHAHCRVRIYGEKDGPATVVITELPGNTGMSVTNASEEIATRLAARWNLDPATTSWIEHYPPTAWREERRQDETFDQITYTWDSVKTAHAPQWRRLTVEEVERMTGDDDIATRPTARL